MDDTGGAGAAALELFPLDDLEPDSARRVEAHGRSVAVVRIGDDVYAIGDTCSHADVSLSQGWVDADDCTLECAQHGAIFDLNTGEPLTLPATRPVPAYDVAVVDGMVVLKAAVGGQAGGSSGSGGSSGASGASGASGSSGWRGWSGTP